MEGVHRFSMAALEMAANHGLRSSSVKLLEFCILVLLDAEWYCGDRIRLQSLGDGTEGREAHIIAFDGFPTLNLAQMLCDC